MGPTNDGYRLGGDLPFGKHTKNYGKSPFFLGKSTINGDFPLFFVCLPEGRWAMELGKHTWMGHGVSGKIS